MCTNILEVVNAKLANAAALARATDEKVTAETELRASQFSTLTDRVFALEVTRDEMATELISKQASLNEITGKIDQLFDQLAQLGVTP